MSKDKDEKKDGDKAKGKTSPEEEAAQAKKKKLLVVGIGGTGLLLGIGAGLFVFLSGGSGKKSEASPPAEHGEAATGEEAEGKASGDHGKAEGKEGHGEGEKKAEGKGGGDHGKAEGKGSGDHGKAEGKGGGDHGKAEGKEGHGEGEKKADGENAEAKKGNKKSAETKLDGVDFGCTAPLTPFHLNLGNPLENRYVRLEIALEYGCSEEQKAEIEKRLPQLRDAIIAVTSRKTREFLLGPDGKEQLRKEIHNRINHYMTKKIDDVYITDILIE